MCLDFHWRHVCWSLCRPTSERCCCLGRCEDGTWGAGASKREFDQSLSWKNGKILHSITHLCHGIRRSRDGLVVACAAPRRNNQIATQSTMSNTKTLPEKLNRKNGGNTHVALESASTRTDVLFESLRARLLTGSLNANSARINPNPAIPATRAWVRVVNQTMNQIMEPRRRSNTRA